MSALSPPPPAFPPNPVVGQPYLNWVWNGSSWVCRAAPGGPVNLIKVFNASGTYWPSPGLTFAVVECLGGGGAGGSVYVPANTIAGGGGGGAGGYSRKTLDAALLTAGVQVTVGAGGTPPAAGAITQGGASSFGAFCVANGGFSAQDNTTSAPNWGNGGAGAPPGVGDLTVRGSGGSGGSLVQGGTGFAAMFGGIGAAGFFGGAPLQTEIGAAQGTNGQPAAPNTGSGGSGAVSNALSAPTQLNGGNGGSGMVIVTEWCFGNISPVQDCGCGQPTPVPPPSPDPCAPCAPAGQNWWGPSW